MYATCCPLPLFAVGACRVAGGGLAIIREPSVQGKLRFSTYTVWHMSPVCDVWLWRAVSGAASG